jgi:hypothetical protein
MNIADLSAWHPAEVTAWLAQLADDETTTDAEYNAARLVAAAALLGTDPDGETVSDTRCPAAHPDDPTPCGGPVVVTVLDAQNAGADGCEHHAARLLASLKGGRVYGLPDAPEGAAIRVWTSAQDLPPFVWA